KFISKEIFPLLPEIVVFSVRNSFLPVAPNVFAGYFFTSGRIAIFAGAVFFRAIWRGSLRKPRIDTCANRPFAASERTSRIKRFRFRETKNYQKIVTDFQ